MLFIRRESLRQFRQLYPIASWIIGINLIIFLIIFLTPTPLKFWVLGLGIGNNFAVMSGDYWRLLTPVFMHSAVMHFLFNSFALILFAPALEAMLGRWKFLLIYLATGILGNVATLTAGLSYPNHLGASGAIYGLLGLYLFMIWRRPQFIDAGSRQMILVLVLIGAVYSFFPGINAYAHFGGLIAGFVLAPLVMNNLQPYRGAFAQATYGAVPGESFDIGFDPDRWQKKKKRQKRLKYVLIGVGVLVIIYLLLTSL